jgi:hypothetical protein
MMQAFFKHLVAARRHRGGRFLITAANPAHEHIGQQLEIPA